MPFFVIPLYYNHARTSFFGKIFHCVSAPLLGKKEPRAKTFSWLLGASCGMGHCGSYPLRLRLLPLCVLCAFVVNYNSRKFLSNCLPGWVRMDSGWNCTPSTL